MSQHGHFLFFLDSKQPSRIMMTKRNAELVLQYSTVYPFRIRSKTMICVYCCEEYEDPKDYRTHLDEAHKTFTVSTALAHCGYGKEYLKVDLTDLKCRICSLPCNNLEEIAEHIREIHGVSKIDLNYEIGMHPYRMDGEKWVCFLCDKKMPSLTKLCRHTTSHYQKYTCDVCGRTYLKNEALKYHIRCSHTYGNHVCRKCWIDFPTLEKKREHLRQSKRCWTFCCISCGERFMSWEGKQKHLIEIHGRQKKMYECPDCEETFESRKHFYTHFKVNHSDDSYVCSCCGLKYGTKKELEEHRFCHTGEKPYRCSICLKLFSRSKSLKQHMWIHSDNKRFICVICNKQFAQKVSLKGHMKTHHPEITLEV